VISGSGSYCILTCSKILMRRVLQEETEGTEERGEHRTSNFQHRKLNECKGQWPARRSLQLAHLVSSCSIVFKRRVSQEETEGTEERGEHRTSNFQHRKLNECKGQWPARRSLQLAHLVSSCSKIFRRRVFTKPPKACRWFGQARTRRARRVRSRGAASNQ
jgi:hypothetical protein